MIVKFTSKCTAYIYIVIFFNGKSNTLLDNIPVPIRTIPVTKTAPRPVRYSKPWFQVSLKLNELTKAF